jgi:fimbrial chaperone protein
MNLKLFCNSLVTIFFVVMLAEAAFAQGFSAGIAPSNFELRAKPGKVIRDTLVIMNAGEKTASYALRTTDWDINETQGLVYMEEKLAGGSCRPWVKLERKVVDVRARGQKRYRFEVHVPEDAGAGLCKFAILVEPAEAAMASVGADEQIRFPVVGRYAVIVYVTIGEAKANIEYRGLGRQEMRGLMLPTLKLHNSGNTYDRVFGRITATDAAGKRHVLIASNFPVLPDHSEEILLVPEATDNGRVDQIFMKYPLRLKGRFEIGGQRFSVDDEFD